MKHYQTISCTKYNTHKYMKTYIIELEVNGEEKKVRWSGYTEKIAIAQCFLNEAQNGARSIRVLDITEVA